MRHKKFGGGVLTVDPNHESLNEWMEVSDHTPVGGYFAATTNPSETYFEEEEKRIFRYVREQATKALNNKDTYEEMLAHKEKELDMLNQKESNLKKLSLDDCFPYNPVEVNPGKMEEK